MTSKELAEKLGVSTATVSLVLNGKAGVSERTRAKVLEGIHELGQDAMIKSRGSSVVYSDDGEELAGEGRSRNIGFVLFQESGQLLGMNSFFPLILNGIESRARDHGYNVVIINIQKEYIREQLRYIQDAGCDGFIIFATEMHIDSVRSFKSIGLPFVILDNFMPDAGMNTVELDNEQGTYLAVKHLKDMGHTKVGYISSGVPINSFIEREFWAKSAMRRLGMEDPEKYSFTTGYPQDASEAAMNEVIKSGRELATAYLADNDLVTFGALQALKKNGIRVPEDVSLIGFDDRPVCELAEPKLTTIAIPRGDFGGESVSRLIRLIDGRAQCLTRTKIECSLVKRESVINRNH